MSRARILGASSGDERVLVVDDNLQNRQVVEGHLVGAGYAVLLAESGEQGLSLFAEQAPDLVLLDILMPGIDGFETCRRLRQLPNGADTPILFLTALSDLSTHQAAMASGGDDFLTKPINRTELLLRVRSLLRIKRIGNELRKSNEELLRAQHQKEELTALIVHDLKNPLTSILANVQFVVGMPTISSDVREALEDCMSGAESMHQMVLNLLDLSRNEEGALVLNTTEVDLVKLVEQVQTVMRRRAEQGNQKLVLASEADKNIVQGDRELLRRLFENLLDNCLKYAPSGGTIRIELNRSSDKVRFRVCDEGPGVPVAFREKIFEKHVQLGRGTQEQARTSRGLGLAFCRLAVELHGGRIWVEDNQPRGSAFCVEMPITQASR